MREIGRLRVNGANVLLISNMNITGSLGLKLLTFFGQFPSKNFMSLVNAESEIGCHYFENKHTNNENKK